MKFASILIALVLCLLSGVSRADDWRAYHHGIDYVSDGNGRYWIFFSAVADPKREIGDEEEWTHSIYVANWGEGDKAITPRLFMRKKGAQEPVSASRSDDGHIMITAEDSHGSDEGVDQRYGVYNSDLTPVEAYPEEVEEGGHSGHVAAVGNRFVIFYSDGWIDGGGVDNLGSGYGVYAKIYNSKGEKTRELDIADDKREWWPMVAGSSDRALLVWQAFVKGQRYARLKMAVLDPATGTLKPVATPEVDLAYYTYNTRYMPAIRRFIVTGATEQGRGSAFLVDEEGAITASLTCMPPTVREAGIFVSGAVAMTPVLDNKMLRLAVTPTSISVSGLATAPFNWAEEGSVGIPNGRDKVRWVSLGRYGLLSADFKLKDFTSAPASGLCR